MSPHAPDSAAGQDPPPSSSLAEDHGRVARGPSSQRFHMAPQRDNLWAPDGRMQTGCPAPGHGPRPGSQVGPGVTLHQGEGALGSDGSPRDLRLTSVRRAAAPCGPARGQRCLRGSECGSDLAWPRCSRTKAGQGRLRAEWPPTAFPGPSVREPASLGRAVAFCASASPSVRHDPEESGWAPRVSSTGCRQRRDMAVWLGHTGQGRLTAREAQPRDSGPLARVRGAQHPCELYAVRRVTSKSREPPSLPLRPQAAWAP